MENEKKMLPKWKNGVYYDMKVLSNGCLKLQFKVIKLSINVISAKQETKEYWNMAATLLDDITKKQSAEVDAVSGATYSSRGIINAAKQALRKQMKKIKKLQWIRIVIQGICFIYFPALFSQAFLGIKNIFVSMGKGTPLVLNDFSVILLLLCLFTMFFGRFFCGFMCAFGAIGDWIYCVSSWLQRKTKKKTPEIPERFALILQKIKYVLLFGIICLCFLQKENLLNENSPWTIFSLLRAGNFSAVSNLCAILLLVIIVAGMAVKERFFCQFLCPMGAVFSLLPQFPFFRLRRRSCLNGCQAWKKLPGINKIAGKSIVDGECISCLKW